jgi:hypothetical protein
MAEMSNYLEDALINATLRATTFTSPATVYVSLHTADPTDAGTGTEVSGGSYARTAATFAAPSNGASSTSADVTFPQATASWGTVTHIGIWDASTSGNMYYHTALDASKTIDTADIFKIASGNLTVTLA